MRIKFIAGILTTVLFNSCHKEYNDYDATVTIEMVAPDTMSIEHMQGTISLINLSNGQQYSISTFKGASVELDVFRGPYSIQGSGTLKYEGIISGKTGVCGFRCNSSYMEILSNPAHLQLDLLLLVDQ